MEVILEDTSISALNDVLLSKLIHLDYNCGRNLQHQLLIEPIPHRIVCLMKANTLEIISYLLLTHDGQTLHIGNICVNPTYRKKGICTHMVKFLVEKYGNITSRIDVPHDVSIHLYGCFRKNGFQFFQRSTQAEILVREPSFARGELHSNDHSSHYIIENKNWRMMRDEEITVFTQQYLIFENIKQEHERRRVHQQEQERIFQQFHQQQYEQQRQQQEQQRQQQEQQQRQRQQQEQQQRQRQQQEQQRQQQNILEPKTFCEKYKCKGKTVKKCYRERSLRGGYRHPDKIENGVKGDEEKFKELGNDYTKISKKQKENEKC